MARHSTIIVFAKPAVPGHVKTRLLGMLSPGEAAALHHASALDAQALAGSLPGCTRLLFLASLTAGRSLWPDRLLGGGWTAHRQRGPRLGERLEHAMRLAFRQAADKVLVIGTDTPWMGAARLATALAWLARDEVVLGPSTDGGYYLVGASRPVPALFRGIPWGTAGVLQATRRSIERAGARHRLLPWDFDLDRPGDFVRARELLARQPERAPHLARWFSEFKRMR